MQRFYNFRDGILQHVPLHCQSLECWRDCLQKTVLFGFFVVAIKLIEDIGLNVVQNAFLAFWR